MALQAQRDYYQLSSAAKVLEDRIAVLRDSIPYGSTIIDIGCNDASISSALIDSGHVRRSYCYDLENILACSRPEITFEALDLFSADLGALPRANGVLLLNIMHHIIGRSVERAREIIDTILNRYEFLIIDLGSCSERGEWGWRKTYDQHWSSDAELWADLFGRAEWRFKLLRYPTQGNGHRVLWKLYKRRYELVGLKSAASFRRTPASWPKDKRIHQLGQEGMPESGLVQSVLFERMVSPQKDQFWVKQYTEANGELRARLEIELSEHAEQTLSYLREKYKKRFKGMRICRPVSAERMGKLFFLYEPDLSNAEVVHFQDWTKFFTMDEVYDISCFGAKQINFHIFNHVQFINFTDFQAARCWDGTALLDFEPNSWLLKISGLRST